VAIAFCEECVCKEPHELDESLRESIAERLWHAVLI
jgi:hypothetical protein